MTEEAPDPCTDEVARAEFSAVFELMCTDFCVALSAQANKQADFLTFIRLEDCPTYLHMATSLDKGETVMMLMTALRSAASESDNAALKELRGFMDGWVRKYLMNSGIPYDETIQ
jgi:hypothetical protein